jgi:hypothetical protein
MVVKISIFEMRIDLGRSGDSSATKVLEPRVLPLQLLEPLGLLELTPVLAAPPVKGLWYCPNSDSTRRLAGWEARRYPRSEVSWRT